MKKVLFLAVLSGLFLGTNAQGIKFGLRGGVSSTQVKMTDAIQVTRAIDGHDTTFLVNFASNTPMGFHGGFFAQVSLGGIFIQPEFLFATTGGEVKVESGNQALYAFSESAKQRNLRIDIPVLVGMKFGPARLGLGPVASFNLLNKDEVADIVSEVAENDGQSGKAETLFKKAVWGVQIGAGLNILGKIALDVKYEFGLSKLGDGMNVQGKEYNFSKRANQAIFSVGYMF